MSKTSDEIAEGVYALRSTSCQLGRLAAAFARTGNAQVAAELDGYADIIAERAQNIHDAYFAERLVETSQSIRNGERFIGSILTGLLAGKEPKDACLEAIPHHFDRELIEERENCSEAQAAR